MQGWRAGGLIKPVRISPPPHSPPLCECGHAQRIKKPPTRLCAISFSRDANPGTRFCWCSENIAPDSDERQESGYQNPKSITLNQRVSEWLRLIEKCHFLKVFLLLSMFNHFFPEI
ncbi:hypothetical protein, partial [Enterobacter cloacae]|uniref:hypothetical protein n=1 Tax=Enterobacter cloacae TaxID=550 RepID=UPI00352B012B